MSAKRTPAVTKPLHWNQFLAQVIDLVETGRALSGRVVNQTITATYWLVGRQIVEHEQSGHARAGYGETLLERLSGELTKRFGRGFSPRNLAQMKALYVWKRILLTPSAKSLASSSRALHPDILLTLSAKSGPSGIPSLPLSWSHYYRLLSVNEPGARSWYESEAIRGGWSVRQLDRQISTLAWLRTKSRPSRLKGESVSASELIRDPFILEFLGLKDEYSETELEESLISELENFLLELGNDFTFVARQKRLRVGDEWYRIDLLFFHRRLRCLVIVDLKIGKFTHADAGQMNLYLNYARENWTNPGEKPPVGLILCAEKDADVAHYALGNLAHQVLAGEYLVALPSEKQLRARLGSARRKLAASRSAVPKGPGSPKKIENVPTSIVVAPAARREANSRQRKARLNP